MDARSLAAGFESENVEVAGWTVVRRAIQYAVWRRRLLKPAAFVSIMQRPGS